MNATQRVQVPFGLKKKLLAATSMLLVAAIMLVSTSYAWFTLSTAPEITGITTSVGANGNLEIALLSTETAADMNLITSNTGDSMEASGQSLVNANLTWGNLIDLDDASYGLNSQQFKLYPAALNIVDGNIGAQPLATPTYGADGRVKQLDASTITAIYDGSAFTDNGINDMGVRAVGTADNVSPRQLVFKTAKSTALSKMDNAAAPVRSAFVQNKTQFIMLAMNMQDGAAANYTAEQVAAMKAIAVGVQNSLKNVVNAYANAGLATAAADTDITDAAVTLCNQQLAGATTATQLKEALNTAGVRNYDAQLTALANQQTAADKVVADADALMATSPISGTDVQSKLVEPLLGGASYIKAYGDDPATKDVVETDALLALDTDTVMNIKKMYLTGGSVGNLATYSGTYSIDYLDVLGLAAFNLYGGDQGVSGELAALKSTVSGLTEPGKTSAANTITTTYGYIIDFAFRTNAATSNLLLQTEAKNRVYSNAEGQDLATMGSGSTATFTYDATGLKAEQAEKLLGSIRVVFFDPTTNAILKGGQFTDITPGATEATGKLELFSVASQTVNTYVLGQNAYTKAEGQLTVPVSYKLKAEYTSANTVDFGNNQLITAVKFNTLPETTTTNGESQNVVGKDAYDVSESKKVDYYKLPTTTITIGSESVTLSASNCSNFATQITAEEWSKLAAESAVQAKTVVNFTDAADDVIVALGQNEPKKVSALVYMDGENIDNSAVVNAASSGSLKLNLQFASDADLVPMENSALKNQTKSAT